MNESSSEITVQTYLRRPRNSLKNKTRICQWCGEEFTNRIESVRTCSRAHAAQLRVSEGKGRQKGDSVGSKVISSYGYVRVMVPIDTPGRDKSGRMLEHRYVMQQAIGRPLADDETVHHRDGNKLNNIIENLQLTRKYHGKGVAMRCMECGSDHIEAVELFDS